jgi:hypothetical protein
MTSLATPTTPQTAMTTGTPAIVWKQRWSKDAAYWDIRASLSLEFLSFSNIKQHNNKNQHCNQKHLTRTIHLHTQTFSLQPFIMSANNNNNNSTLKSYVDSATGAVQNVVGSIIGSTGDEVSMPPKPHPSYFSTQTSILTRDTK